MRRLLKKIIKPLNPMNSKRAETFWASQHQRKPGWAESYWRQDEKREALANFIINLGEVSSVFEAGCNVGANLYAIHMRNPSLKLGGVDINSEAIAYGAKKFGEEGIDCSLREGSLYDLSFIEDESYDVVLTSAVLLHIPPDGIGKVIESLNRIARKAMVFCELHSSYPWELKYYQSLQFGDRWARDYSMLIKELTSNDDVIVINLPYELSSQKISLSDKKVDANCYIVTSKCGRKPIVCL